MHRKQKQKKETARVRIRIKGRKKDEKEGEKIEKDEEKVSEESEREENAGKGEERKIRLKGLKTTYMRFCIALLTRKSKMREYKLPLICAIAILGINKKRWRTPENYSLIISRVIKIARFMIIQSAI